MHRILPVMVLSLSLLVVNVALASPVRDAIDIQRAADAPHLQTTQTPTPTSPSSGEPEGTVPTGPPLPLTLTLLGLCCAFLILIGVVVLGFVVRRENRQLGKNE